MRLKFAVSTIVSFLLLSGVALAIPGTPHVFYGSVTLNGSPAPDGTVVSARINGIQVASTTTMDGKYGYEPMFFVDDPNSARLGQDVVFFVSGSSTGQTISFCNACFNDCGTSTSDCSPFDLSVTIGSSSTDTTDGNTGGGGGGGSGAATPVVICDLDGVCDSDEDAESCPSDCGGTSSSPAETETCEESWTCTEWGSCVDGLKARTCTDDNDCGTIEDKPFETQPCSTEEIAESTSVLSMFTGLAVSMVENSIYVIPLVVIVVVILILILKFPEKFKLKSRRKKKRKN